MYLHRKTYVKNWDHREFRWEIAVTRDDGKPTRIDTSKVCEITEEMGYWRKANAIHAWFVQNVQDGRDECQEAWVSAEQLRELLGTCQRVLEARDPVAVGGEHLPPQSGFFFGSTEIDQWYMEDIQSTVAILTEILEADPDLKGDYYYQSSW
jgi:hypothetical protein